MTRNMATIDRLVRGILIAPVAIVVGIIAGPVSAIAIVFYAVAALMLVTALVGFCPLYALFGLRTKTAG